MSRALARHLEHARNPQWVYEPGDIIGMRKLINDWTRFADGSMRSKMRELFDRIGMDAKERERDCYELLETLHNIPHAISPAFTAKGLRWFDSMHTGMHTGGEGSPRTWRNTKLTRMFDARKRAIVDGFEAFQFVGFDNNGGNWYFPVYRVWGNTKGQLPGGTLDRFDYCYGSWQSGQGVTFPNEPIKVEPGKFITLDVSKCPHAIMVPEHYRNNGKCLCDDPNATIMRKWGYRWNKAKGVWT